MEVCTDFFCLPVAVLWIVCLLVYMVYFRILISKKDSLKRKQEVDVNFPFGIGSRWPASVSLWKMDFIYCRLSSSILDTRAGTGMLSWLYNLKWWKNGSEKIDTIFRIYHIKSLSTRSTTQLSEALHIRMISKLWLFKTTGPDPDCDVWFFKIFGPDCDFYNGSRKKSYFF